MAKLTTQADPLNLSESFKSLLSAPPSTGVSTVKLFVGNVPFLGTVDDESLILHSASDDAVMIPLHDIYNIRPEANQVHYIKEGPNGQTVDAQLTCEGDAEIRSMLEKAQRKWEAQLGEASPLHPRHAGGNVLVLINGAIKSATELFNTIVFPMLDKGGVPFVAEKTARRGHGMEITAAIDPQKTCAVLCIGGDGTVHEALNGLAGAGLLGKIPVGVVCGGSGNGLATSLGHEDPRVAVLSLLQGHTLDIDTVRVDFGVDVPPVFGCVVVSWGFHANLVRNSDRLRGLMGPARFTVVGVSQLLTHRPPVCDIHCLGVARRIRTTLGEPLDWVRDLDAAVDGEEVANFHVEGAVPYILAAKAMTLAPNFTPTPFASATDGHLDLMLFRPGTKRAEFKAAFQGIAAGLGAHTELPFVEYIKCTGFTIQPEATKGETAVCVDGEIYNLLSRARLKVAIHGEKLQIYA